MPDTLAPIESKIIDNQAPLKPVCPVTNIFLFLKKFFKYCHQVFHGGLLVLASSSS